VAVRVWTPSPLEALLVVQLAGSTPAAVSVQFQETVTSLVFQPAALAVGDWLGLAVGGVVSGVYMRVTEVVPLVSVAIEVLVAPGTQKLDPAPPPPAVVLTGTEFGIPPLPPSSYQAPPVPGFSALVAIHAIGLVMYVWESRRHTRC